jgi:hypothetical protein
LRYQFVAQQTTILIFFQSIIVASQSYKIKNEILDNDFIEQFIQIAENKILTEMKGINENFTELQYKIKSPSEKYLKYIINFEIINNDIKDFFIKNNIIKEDKFISLYSFKAFYGKILIIFEKDNTVIAILIPLYNDTI